MNMQLGLVLSTLIIPLALSFLVQRLAQKKQSITILGFFITWLISYLWIAGIPSFFPKEAIEWSVYLGATFIIASFIITSLKQQALLFSALYILGVTLIVWPVITHSPELQLFAELIFFTLIGIIVAFRMEDTSTASPALSIGISNGGLAIVAGLGGSLLIGQLAGALASALGAFAIYELFKKLEHTQLNYNTRLLSTLLSLLLLVVARIYAELPLVSITLLALALALGLTTKWRYASGLSLVMVTASITYLLLTTDESSYY